MGSLTKYNFKVGDKVRVLDTAHVRSWNKNKGVIGYIFTINCMRENNLASFNEGHAWCIDLDNKYGINYLPSDLEKVPEVIYSLLGTVIASINDKNEFIVKDWFISIIDLIPDNKEVQVTNGKSITIEEFKKLIKNQNECQQQKQ